MGFNVYLPAGKLLSVIKSSRQKFLHDMQRCVLLHGATNLTNLLCKKLRERSTPQRHI